MSEGAVLQITNACCSEYDEYNGMYLPDVAERVGKSDFAVLLDVLDKSHAEARVLFLFFLREVRLELKKGTR